MISLTTIALTAALYSSGTVTSTFGVGKFRKSETSKTSLIRTIALKNEQYHTTENVSEEDEIFGVINDVNAMLCSYFDLKPEWDGPDSVKPTSADIDKAIEFVNSMPPVLPLPRAMLSRDGTVGLYWDDSIVFVDIQIEPNDMISIFSKNRSTGKESFDELKITSIDKNWYLNKLYSLLYPAREILVA